MVPASATLGNSPPASVPFNPPGCWFYSSGPLRGRLEKQLLRKGSFGRDGLRLAVVASDLGMNGGTKVGDILHGFKRPVRKSRNRGARAADWIFKLLGGLGMMALIFTIGVAACLVIRRSALQLTAGSISSTSSMVIKVGSDGEFATLRGILQFDLLVHNPSSFINQLRFDDNHTEVRCLLRPLDYSDADGCTPLGAAYISSRQSAVSVPANSRDFAIPFEAALVLSPAEVNSTKTIETNSALNDTLLKLYIEQCSLGYLLMEVIVTKIVTYTFANKQSWPPSRSPSLAVPCRVLSTI